MSLLRNLLAATLPLAMAACAVSEPGTLALPGAINAPPPPMNVTGDALLTNVTWKWQGTLLPNGTRIVPESPDRYAIELQPGGKMQVRADCNRGRASYLLNGPQLSFSAIGMTKMLCPEGSREAEFMKQLAAVSAQSFQGNDLVLTLSGNGGTMRFSSPRQ